ncbi:ATP-binding protein [Vibrio sp. SCSIO 43136]|uniref:ATP-binding protein n=1 Tax=Vibrio sp. SCSIO 43136 TaxID=2819101 RepID=UPI0020761814|nr:ATP-binding protein [Vibrio sp. SCSIO 43136]USD66783.1 HAMP domain-containing protein [Vibrio sp. SCSIO 43136]
MSLKFKTIFGVALIEAILLAILVTLTLSYLKTTNYEGLTVRGESTANLFVSTVKDSVLSYDLASLDSYSDELVTNPDLLYVRVLNAEGKILAAKGLEEFRDRFNKPELSADLVTDGVYDVSKPIVEAGIQYGQVQIGFDMSSLNEQIAIAKKWTAFIVLGEMALVALFSYVLGSFLTKRLGKLQLATERLSEGRRDISLNEQGSDEVAKVAKAFNAMVQQLKKSEQTTLGYQNRLEELNASLENKVAERTAELNEKNIHLEQANIALKEAQAKLIQTEKLAAVGTMAAGYAHEINNPLGTIDSNLQLSQEYLEDFRSFVDELTQASSHSSLSDSQIKTFLSKHSLQDLEEDFQDSLQDARNNVARVKKVVHGLKSYSQIENQTSTRPTNIVNLIQASIKESQIYEPNSQVNLNCFTDISSLTLDEIEIQQAIVNIIKNSQYATKNTPNAMISIDVTENDKSIQVTISDNGDGMHPAQVKKAFDPFYTTKPIGKGSGLGLTQARNTIIQHQGTIEIDSQLEVGTKVSISLMKPDSSQTSKQAMQ